MTHKNLQSVWYFTSPTTSTVNHKLMGTTNSGISDPKLHFGGFLNHRQDKSLGLNHTFNNKVGDFAGTLVPDLGTDTHQLDRAKHRLSSQVPLAQQITGLPGFPKNKSLGMT